MQDFTNKVAVITGGASGVGRSLAFALGRRGAKIAIGDVDKAAMEQVREGLRAENIEAIYRPNESRNRFDVTKSHTSRATLASGAFDDAIEVHCFRHCWTGHGGGGCLIADVSHCLCESRK